MVRYLKHYEDRMKAERECLSCMAVMKGIFSYEIRDVCIECGGYAKKFNMVAIKGGLKAA